MDNPYTLYEVDSLNYGDHLCCLYNTENEHRALLTLFLSQGLTRNDKIIYIVDVHSSQVVINYLKKISIDVDLYLERGQFIILSAKDTYLKEGYFDPDKMIELLKAETEIALKEGYAGLRVTGEMTWALKELPGSDRLIEYESKLNKFFPNSKCLAICQYDMREFSPDLILKVIETHPIMIMGTEFFQNFYFTPPDEFLSENPEKLKMNRWIRHLKDRKQAELKIIEHENSLYEKINELNCLYGISKLLEYPNISIEEIIEGTIQLIPPAFKFPKISCSRIIYDAKEYKTENCEETPYKLSYDVIVNDQIMKIEVFYIENRPFLKEEKFLLKEIGDRLKIIIDWKLGEIKLKNSEKKYRIAFNRSEFYKDLLSHDIKNILQVLSLSTSYGIDNLDNKEHLREGFTRIMEQIEKIDRLIENVNKFSKLEESEQSLELVDLYKILEKAIDFIHKNFLDRNINIYIKSAEENHLIYANEFLIDVFDNLLSNAIRHNDNTEIEILIRIESENSNGLEYFKLEFIDNGKGISDARKNDIFQRFNQNNRMASGLGSGLSLVSKIISVYGGKIWVEDKVKGDHSKGSKFIILIPKFKIC